jgi:hypothetical protein
MRDKTVAGTMGTPASIPDAAAADWHWQSLNNAQVGRYGEYIAKLELTRMGLDIYSVEVDDHGIDFVVRSRDGMKYADIQVKTIRGLSSYVFMPDDKFPPKDNLYLALVLLPEGSPPKCCLVPRSAWGEGHPDYLVHHDYIGLKSKPECGINISARAVEAIVRDYSMDTMAALLK